MRIWLNVRVNIYLTEFEFEKDCDCVVASESECVSKCESACKKFWLCECISFYALCKCVSEYESGWM